MELIACDGTWIHQNGTLQDGRVICDGTLLIVSQGGPFGLPELTYEDANLILDAVLMLYATVWGAKKLFGLVR